MTPVMAYGCINALPYQQNSGQNALQPRLRAVRILINTEISVFHTDAQPNQGFNLGVGGWGVNLDSNLVKVKKSHLSVQGQTLAYMLSFHQMLWKDLNKMSADVQSLFSSLLWIHTLIQQTKKKKKTLYSRRPTLKSQWYSKLCQHWIK